MSIDAIEELLDRVVPNYGTGLDGLSDSEIAELEAQSECEFTEVYHWFLGRMGRAAGSLASIVGHMCLDENREAREYYGIAPEPPLCFLGALDHSTMPLLYFQGPVGQRRGDAPVLRGLLDEHPVVWSESLREWLAWQVVNDFKVYPAAVSIRGSISYKQGNAVSVIDQVLLRAGFECPVSCGDFSRVLLSDGMSFISRVTPSSENLGLQIFRMGGADESAMRALLGRVSLDGGIQIKIKEIDRRR